MRLRLLRCFHSESDSTFSWKSLRSKRKKSSGDDAVSSIFSVSTPLDSIVEPANKENVDNLSQESLHQSSSSSSAPKTKASALRPISQPAGEFVLPQRSAKLHPVEVASAVHFQQFEMVVEEPMKPAEPETQELFPSTLKNAIDHGALFPYFLHSSVKRLLMYHQNRRNTSSYKCVRTCELRSCSFSSWNGSSNA